MKENEPNDAVPTPDIPYDGEEPNIRKKLTMSQRNAIVKNKVRDYLLDHPKVDFACRNSWVVFASLISAFIFAYGFLSFTNPLRVPWSSISGNDALLEAVRTYATSRGVTDMSLENLQNFYNALEYNVALSIVGNRSLVSGGASGFSQVVSRLLSFAGIYREQSGVQENTVIAILYVLLNVPFLVLAWLKIGKKFTIYTLFNIGFSSLFLRIIPAEWCELTNIYNDFLARALAGGLCTGLSIGIAFAVGSATGAVDIISLFFAERKSTSVGKYSMIVNTATVLSYTLLHFAKAPSDPEGITAWDLGVNQTTMALYTIVYFFVGSKLLDIINIKNKKVELQIFTSYPEMAKVLISGFPHACTLVNGVGGFTGTPRHIIYMVVSKGELKRAVQVMKEADPNCFVSVLSTYQVYGKFYIKPIE